MIRGTTPTHVFTLNDFDTSRIKELRLTYQQRRKNIVEKTLDDVTLNANTIMVVLTQEETLKFTTTDVVDVQIKVLTTEDKVLASDIISIDAERILNEDIMS